MDRRITNGLAWAGVFLVVGVPTADFLSSQFLDNPRVDVAAIASEPDQPEAQPPVPRAQRPPQSTPATESKSAAGAPRRAEAAGGGAVDSFVQSGKPMPSYITGDAPEEPAPAPARTAAVTPPKTPVAIVPATPAPPAVASVPVAPAPATVAPVRQQIVTDPVETASLPPKLPPIPMPLSMRPGPVQTAAVPTQGQAPLIIEEPVFNRPVVVPRNEVVPPNDVVRPPADVTADDLEDWEAGPLSDFLAQRQGGNSQAYEEPPYYDDAPQGDRLLGPAGLEQFLFPFDGY
jgi:hypothetical protein